jgi:hypothetical protein
MLTGHSVKQGSYTMTEQEIAKLKQALIDDGYDPDVAEALAENHVTVEQAASLSKYEVMDHYLNWNGIIGFTQSILDALNDCERNCNM